MPLPALLTAEIPLMGPKDQITPSNCLTLGSSPCSAPGPSPERWGPLSCQTSPGSWGELPGQACPWGLLRG